MLAEKNTVQPSGLILRTGYDGNGIGKRRKRWKRINNRRSWNASLVGGHATACNQEANAESYR
jgi:hypothetical protein